MKRPVEATAESMQAYLQPLLAPWLEKASALVIKRVEDARTHAEKALTQTLIGTPDGRATWATVQRSPSYNAAFNRLDELLDAIAGPSKRSLEGTASDARSAALQDGWEYWPASIPAHLLASSRPSPTAAQDTWARGLIVFNQDDRSALQGPIDSAKRSLTMAVVAAAMQAAKDSERTRLLKNWQTSATLTIGTAVAGRVQNSYIVAFNAAGLLVIHPDFHPEPL